MKIGIDVSRANNLQKTGVEWYTFYLVQELKKIIPENVEVVLYSAEILQGELANLPKNWTTKVLIWPPKRLWTQLRLSWEMLFYRPDILFIPAHVFPIIHPQKTVMTIHDIAALDFGDSYNAFEKWYSLFSSRQALKKLWKIITPSIFTKQELKRLLFQNFPEEKIKVVYHGFNQNYKNIFSTEEKNKVLTKYKIGTNFLLSISRLEHKKNTLGIIKAFEILKNNIDNHDLQLVLVGKQGFGCEEIFQAIEKSVFKNDIILPGWVREEDLTIILSSARVFVFPSFYEGFGLPILQAMSAGIPIVTSRCSSLPEIGREVCLYVDPNNALKIAENINIFLTDEKLRQEKIKLGLLRVKDFSWEKCARETWDLLFK
ncbi:MAG: glycosyltransferase family 1 protein [Candidatus Magasanikbacteria bacterium]